MEEPKYPNLNNRTGNRRQKGRRSAPKAEDRRVAIHNDPYEYTFRDPQVGELKVLRSDQDAWWSGEQGRIKIQKLIDAWKIDANDQEAMFYAGISEGQLKYFQKLHPDVYPIKDRCKQNLGLIAKKNFAKEVENNKDGASLSYLRMKRKDEGYSSRTEQAGVDGRDLFEGLSEKIEGLGEVLRKAHETQGKKTKEEKHTDSDPSGHTDAGQNGDGDETSAPKNVDGSKGIPVAAGRTV